MESQYNPNRVEEKWYKYWEEKGFFHVEPRPEKKSYCIVIPPPNITGILHMGHALNNTIQDILIRWRRLQGFCTLWIPGTDHAGIATQNVVERELAREGLTRDDLGREKFLQRVWQWKEEYGSKICQQLRKLGASCDWQRERFTMDEVLSDAVLEAFVLLYQEGLIYRGNYIINWCPRCKTALSDEEVEYYEQEGYLYYLKYPVIDSKGKFITVATTRPETMLGDVAVAVHPKDRRYEFLKDKKILLPLINRELVLVRDSTVDPEFGTGAVKVTPGHDPTDFEIALRHNLKPVVVMNEAGIMNENAGQYQGMDRFECRKKIITDLDAQDLVEKIEPYPYSLGHCYRCETIIEPYISWQWFLNMKPLAEPAIKVVKEGKIKFFPRRWEKVYLHWMQDIKEWCISRQIWWGHRMPLYYCKNCWQPESQDKFKIRIKNIKKLKGVIVAKTKPKACPECGCQDIVQEQDVLDTWFSSWLWPFSTMGWPHLARSKELIANGQKQRVKDQRALPDIDYFYPTSTLVTAQEILFFWVARMIMAGLKFLGEIPFKHVYIHGTVKDEKGRKMSKSLGNIIDPSEIINKYGADALRISLISITSMGQDVFLSKDRFIFGRNFTNKIWNAARFLILNLNKFKPEAKILNYNLFDNWFLSSLQELIIKVNKALEGYNFNEAGNLIYEFFWHKFCDWYIELKKSDLKSQKKEISEPAKIILVYVLDNLLKLLHPFMPFITEDIWQRLKQYLPGVYRAMNLNFKESACLMLSTWPEVIERFIDKTKSANVMANIIDIIQCIRNIRAELNVPADKKTKVIISGNKTKLLKNIKNYSAYFKPLANISEIETQTTDISRPLHSAFGIVGGVKIYVLLEGVIDIVKEKKRLEKKRQVLLEELKLTRKKLLNREFLSKANRDVVSKVKGKEVMLQEQIQAIESIIRHL